MEWKYFLRPSIRGLHEGYLRVIGKQLCLLIFYLLSLIVLEQGDQCKKCRVLFIKFNNVSFWALKLLSKNLYFAL